MKFQLQLGLNVYKGNYRDVIPNFVLLTIHALKLVITRTQLQQSRQSKVLLRLQLLHVLVLVPLGVLRLVIIHVLLRVLLPVPQLALKLLILLLKLQKIKLKLSVKSRLHYKLKQLVEVDKS